MLSFEFLVSKFPFSLSSRMNTTHAQRLTNICYKIFRICSAIGNLSIGGTIIYHDLISFVLVVLSYSYQCEI